MSLCKVKGSIIKQIKEEINIGQLDRFTPTKQRVEVVTVDTKPHENMSMKDNNTTMSFVSGLTSLTHTTTN